MNVEKCGQFIAKLRKEHNMTQQQVADIAFVTRESVSKWERGVNLPDPQALLVLSKIFAVSVNELLYGEYVNDENKEDVENTTVDVMKYELKKRFKIIMTSICTILILIIGFLLAYFVDNYNSIKLFVIAGEGDHFLLTQGLLLNFKDNSYLQLGEIINSTDEEINHVSLIYKKNKIEDVVVSNEELKQFNGKLDLSFMLKKYSNDWMDYLYLNVGTESEEEMIKLGINLINANNLLNIDSSIIEETTTTVDSSVDKARMISDTSTNTNILTNVLDKFELVDETYVYEGKNYKYEYNEERHCVYTKDNLHVSLNSGLSVYKDVCFDLNNLECLKGNCDKYRKVFDKVIEDLG